MSLSDIADYLGLPKETVSRVISALKRERIIRLETLEVIQILARERLEQLAEAAA
jgi:CRP/FNR family transcriptional regulator